MPIRRDVVSRIGLRPVERTQIATVSEAVMEAASVSLSETQRASRQRLLLAVAAAQSCAFLNAVTAVSSEAISRERVDVSTFQASADAALRSRSHASLCSHGRRVF